MSDKARGLASAIESHLQTDGYQIPFCVQMPYGHWKEIINVLLQSESDQRGAVLEEAARKALHALDSLPVNYASAEREALRRALETSDENLR